MATSAYDLHVQKLRSDAQDARQQGGATKINQANTLYIPSRRQFFSGYSAPKTESDVNCSACTAAAIARTRTQKPEWNTQTVNQSTGFSGRDVFIDWRRATEGGVHTDLPATAGKSDKDLQDQVDGLAEWCCRTLGVKRKRMIGNAKSPVASTFALSWMKAQDDGTLFAVYVFRGLFTAHDVLAHWIYAEKHDGNLRFVDYQTDKAEVQGSTPAESTAPMKPGGQAIDGTYQMIVIAFLPDQGSKPLTGGRLI